VSKALRLPPENASAPNTSTRCAARAWVCRAPREGASIDDEEAGTLEVSALKGDNASCNGIRLPTKRGQLDVWVPGRAVVDHKTLLGAADRQVLAARGYAGQLQAYAGMVHSAQGVEVERWIHLPLAGLMIRFGAPVMPPR